MKWADLAPEIGIEKALTLAGSQPEIENQDAKRHWSETFANGCAVAVADEFRASKLQEKTILPISVDKGTEPLTPLGTATKKRIDVTVVDPILGLEVGVSLKGFNFRDARSRNFDKNLTGRIYELSDEVRLVHEHLPHAFMAAVFFLPLDATSDKKSDNTKSSFAHAVLKLRERTGRLDTMLTGQASRCDAGYVALYSLGSEDVGSPRGAARFFSVNAAPPKRGRPKINQTLSLREMVQQIVALATHQTEDIWGDAEPD